jgi:HEPN domain-containing protein
MPNKENAPEEIERILEFTLRAKKKDPSLNNLMGVEHSLTFESDMKTAGAPDFSSSAEQSYAVARLLLQLRVHWYAYFCAQQTVENYLKAYIKARGMDPRVTHSLRDLLIQCRESQPTSSFVASEHIEAVVLKFDGFNEAPRYLVQRRKPGTRAWVGSFPDDMYILDYFVFCIRKELPAKGSRGSLFTTGHIDLFSFEKTWPGIYALVTDRNINFE